MFSHVLLKKRSIEYTLFVSLTENKRNETTVHLYTFFRLFTHVFLPAFRKSNVFDIKILFYIVLYTICKKKKKKKKETHSVNTSHTIYKEGDSLGNQTFGHLL